MATTGTITMSMRELDRLKVVQAVVERNLKCTQAAKQLDLTVGQVQRLVKRYQMHGATRLVSGKRGRRSNHQLPAGLASQALTIIQERYADFGPTLVCEKLRECHGIALGTETVRKLMADAGLWIPRALRSPTIYQPRNRRHCLGELIQIDGSDHRWFEDRGPACTLLVYIDDATSRLMHLHFTYSESTFSYFEATRRYIELHGKPQALYSDKASVFRCNAKHATSGDGYTQFGRALYELNIQSICANSSQAKGRVERPTRPCRTGSSRNCGWRAFRPWPRPMRMRPLSWPTITGALPKPRAMTEMRTGRYSMTALFHQDPVTPVLSRV